MKSKNELLYDKLLKLYLAPYQKSTDSSNKELADGDPSSNDRFQN